VGLIVRGIASQTGDLIQAQNSTPTTLWTISANGLETIRTSGSIYGTNSSISANTGSAANTGIIVRGVASQTGDLFRAESSTPATLFTVSGSGFITVGTAGSVLGTNAAASISPTAVGNNGLIVQGIASGTADEFVVRQNSGSQILLSANTSTQMVRVGSRTDRFGVGGLLVTASQNSSSSGAVMIQDDNNNQNAVLRFYTSGASNGATPASAQIGVIRWYTRGTSVTLNPASIIVTTAASATTDTSTSASMTFSTTPVGSSLSVERMRLDATGEVKVGGNVSTLFTSNFSIQGTTSGVANLIIRQATGQSADMIILQSTGGTSKFSIDNDYLINSDSMHNNAAAQTNSGTSQVRSGTYTPTLTAVANVSASTPRQGQWMRVGNVVTVSLIMDITNTGIGAASIGIELPIPSDFASAFECAGSGHAQTLVGHGGPVVADDTNDRAQFNFSTTAISSDTFGITFTYEVI